MIVLTAMGGSSFPASVPLPDDFAPEGIAVGTGSTFYVGSLIDGDIYRGDLRSGRGSIFVDVDERQAVGLKVDQPHRRLFVAGGFTGRGFVYDTRDGSTVADVVFAPPGSALVNDVVVTKGGAYFTDSFNPVLYRVPMAPDGTLGPPESVTIEGPAAAVIAGVPNLNGIDATANGDTLVVAHSELGALFTIDPATGQSRQIALIGGSLTPGTPDGILLDGRSLWVVENFANRLVEVRLSPDLSSGRVASVLTNDDVGRLFRVPATVAGHGDRLAVVNARFDQGLPPPFGSGAPPGTDYDVAVVRKP
jgi:hypothetical protein